MKALVLIEREKERKMWIRLSVLMSAYTGVLLYVGAVVRSNEDAGDGIKSCPDQSGYPVFTPTNWKC